MSFEQFFENRPKFSYDFPTTNIDFEKEQLFS